MVLIPLSVTDGRNHPVLGLEIGDFQVFDRNRLQQVLHLSFEDSPLTVGILLDTSGSMRNKMAKARAAVAEFLKTANSEDEFFLVEFDNAPRLEQGFTSDPGDIDARLAATVPNGRTALLDAIGMGLRELKKSQKARKALVVISDGGDNRSRYTEPEIGNLLRESEASLYAMGVFEGGALSLEEIEGPALLGKLAEMSGGRLFTVGSAADLPAVAARIGVELHNLYLLGYSPTNLQSDGKYHRVQIKLVGGKDALRVDWRDGYHAPTR